MAKLKLGPLPDNKPVRLSVELPAQVHRDLVDYADALAREFGGGPPAEPAKLIPPMLARFMATDRAFARKKRTEVTHLDAPASDHAGQDRRARSGPGG